MFRFSAPYLLLLLGLIPLLLWRRRRNAFHPALRLADALPAQAAGKSLALALLPGVDMLKYAALALMLLALAGPQKGTRELKVLTEGINIMLAVDVSGSMAALDFDQKDLVLNRLEAVKQVVADFIAEREGDRIGLVVFGSEAYTQLPLTRDYDAILAALKHIEIGSAGTETALGDGLGISLKRILEVESKSDVVILLTDGQSNAGELAPMSAAGIAKRAGVRVYTIGVGTRGKAPFIIDDPVFGRRKVMRQVSIDENTLTAIARETGGLYQRAVDREGLVKVYETINELEKNQAEVKVYAEYDNLYPYLLLPAFILLALWVALSNTRFMRLP